MNLLSGLDQDHHRDLRWPGAYEWWHFDGTDERSALSFSLQFFAGNLFSARYQDSLKTYWQKTKSPLTTGEPAAAPPDPRDFSGVSLKIFQKGSLIGEASQEFSSQFLKASDSEGAVMLGPNRFNWDQGDPPSYIVTVQAPLPGSKKLLRARLFFTPLVTHIPDLPAPATHSTHTWVLTAPLCHVEGTFQWCDANGDVTHEKAFVGKGVHDHHFGSVPMDRFVKSWHWGRAFLGDKTVLYSLQLPQDPQEKIQSIIVTLDKNKVESVERWDRVFFSQGRHNFFWLPYAKQLSWTTGLTIRHENILADGPVSVVFGDKVRVGALQGPGLSQYLFTPRLSKRLFFPMLKAKTTYYDQKQDLPDVTKDPHSDVFNERPPQ